MLCCVASLVFLLSFTPLASSSFALTWGVASLIVTPAPSPFSSRKGKTPQTLGAPSGAVVDERADYSAAEQHDGHHEDGVVVRSGLGETPSLRGRDHQTSNDSDGINGHRDRVQWPKSGRSSNASRKWSVVSKDHGQHDTQANVYATDHGESDDGVALRGHARESQGQEHGMTITEPVGETGEAEDEGIIVVRRVHRGSEAHGGLRASDLDVNDSGRADSSVLHGVEMQHGAFASGEHGSPMGTKSVDVLQDQGRAGIDDDGDGYDDGDDGDNSEQHAGGAPESAVVLQSNDASLLTSSHLQVDQPHVAKSEDVIVKKEQDVGEKAVDVEGKHDEDHHAVGDTSEPIDLPPNGLAVVPQEDAPCRKEKDQSCEDVPISGDTEGVSEDIALVGPPVESLPVVATGDVVSAAEDTVEAEQDEADARCADSSDTLADDANVDVCNQNDDNGDKDSVCEDQDVTGDVDDVPASVKSVQVDDVALAHGVDNASEQVVGDPSVDADGVETTYDEEVREAEKSLQPQEVLHVEQGEVAEEDGVATGDSQGDDVVVADEPKDHLDEHTSVVGEIDENITTAVAEAAAGAPEDGVDDDADDADDVAALDDAVRSIEERAHDLDAVSSAPSSRMQPPRFGGGRAVGDEKGADFEDAALSRGGSASSSRATSTLSSRAPSALSIGMGLKGSMALNKQRTTDERVAQDLDCVGVGIVSVLQIGSAGARDVVVNAALNAAKQVVLSSSPSRTRGSMGGRSTIVGAKKKAESRSGGLWKVFARALSTCVFPVVDESFRPKILSLRAVRRIMVSLLRDVFTVRLGADCVAQGDTVRACLKKWDIVTIYGAHGEDSQWPRVCKAAVTCGSGILNGVSVACLTSPVRGRKDDMSRSSSPVHSDNPTCRRGLILPEVLTCAFFRFIGHSKSKGEGSGAGQEKLGSFMRSAMKYEWPRDGLHGDALCVALCRACRVHALVAWAADLPFDKLARAKPVTSPGSTYQREMETVDSSALTRVRDGPWFEEYEVKEAEAGHLEDATFSVDRATLSASADAPFWFESWNGLLLNLIGLLCTVTSKDDILNMSFAAPSVTDGSEATVHVIHVEEVTALALQVASEAALPEQSKQELEEVIRSWPAMAEEDVGDLDDMLRGLLALEWM